MRVSLTKAFATLGVFAALTFVSAPAYAQAGGDDFTATAGTGVYGEHGAGNTGGQTTQLGAGAAPALQGATNGTIGPQGGDATYVTGLNTAGTVRVNNL